MKLNLYSQKPQNMLPRFALLTLEIIFIFFSYLILFKPSLLPFQLTTSHANLSLRLILFIFNMIIFFRFLLTFFVFLKRHIPLEEVFSVACAFFIYYVIFPFLFVLSPHHLNIFDFIGIALFILGSALNTLSEHQRLIFKKNPSNKGKIFNQKLFKHIRHVNFLGDILWVLGYSILVSSIFSYLVVFLLTIFFIFVNIPKLEKHLIEHYKEDFFIWKKSSYRLIPFIY